MPGTFDSLMNLDELDLSHNKLTNFDKKELLKNCEKFRLVPPTLKVKTEGNPCHSSIDDTQSSLNEKQIN